MLEFWRNLRKSAEARRQEQIDAYVDGALSTSERAAFEQQLAEDADLRAEVETLQLLKQNLSRLPRRRAPRNFTLDPAIYGKPERQPLFQLYPVLPVATALTAVLFVFLIGLETLNGFSLGAGAPAADESVAQFEIAPAAEAVEEAVEEVEVTRVVTETEIVTETVTEAIVAEEFEEEMAEEEAMDEEAPAEEEAMEEEEVLEESALEPTPLPLATPIAEGLSPSTGGGLDDATMATVPENGDSSEDVVPTVQPYPEPYPLPAAEAGVAEVEAYDVPETAVVESDDSTDMTADLPVEPEERTPEPQPQPINPLRAGQIAVGVLLLILIGLMVYIRRLR